MKVNQRVALTMFVRKAWSPLAGEYERSHDLNGDDPLDTLEFFIAKLGKDLGHDGLGSGKQPLFEQSKRRKTDKRDKPAKEDGHANAVIPERRHKPAWKPKQGQSTNRRSGQFKCYICGSSGHVGDYHKKYIEKPAAKSVHWKDENHQE